MRSERDNAGDHAVLILDENGDVVQRNLFGPMIDQILAEEKVDPASGDQNVLWPLADTSGSVRDILGLGGINTNSVPLEVGTLEGIDNSQWTTVQLSDVYDSMVVVATIESETIPVPLVVRIQNAEGSSFDIKVQRVDGLTGTVAGVKIHYTVVEEGVYTLAEHGIDMEAVKVESTVTDFKTSWNGEQQTYQNSYTEPVVLGQVMSYNDTRWSTFWSRGANKVTAPSSTDLYVGKHVNEDPVQTRNDETIGYIVLEAGDYTLGNAHFSAVVGDDVIRGVDDNLPTSKYSLTGFSDLEVVVATQTAMDGRDGGWAILYGTDAVTNTEITLRIDEDQIGDSERLHTNEQVAYVAFEQLPNVDVYSVVNHIVYDSFGNVTSETSTEFQSMYGFAGREIDSESDLVYMRARHYDPHLGRFISEDPIGFNAGDTNLSRYVENGPTNQTDPSGLDGYSEIMRKIWLDPYTPHTPESLAESFKYAFDSEPYAKRYYHLSHRPYQYLDKYERKELELLESLNTNSREFRLAYKKYRNPTIVARPTRQAQPIQDVESQFAPNAAVFVPHANGSTNPINPNIDPWVLQQLSQSGQIDLGNARRYGVWGATGKFAFVPAESDGLYDARRKQWRAKTQAQRQFVDQYAVPTMMVAGGILPGPGEAMDFMVLVDPKSSTWQRVGAAVSLGISVFTLFGSPNYGSVRQVNRIVDGAPSPAAVQNAGRIPQDWMADLSHVTGKTATSRNRAIQSVITDDLPDLRLTHTPQYSPIARTGLAKENVGTQIGYKSFESRSALRDVVVHEELHHRWFGRGLRSQHHNYRAPSGEIVEVATDAKFYATIERYKRMRGWSYNQKLIDAWEATKGAK